MQASNSLKLFFFILSALLFFIPLPQMLNQPISKECQNLGHVVIFFIFGLILLGSSPLQNRTYLKRALVLFTAVAFVGGSVELIQLNIAGRYGNMQDLYKDLLGAGIAYLYVIHGALIPWYKKLLVRLAAVLLILVALYPLASLLMMSYQLQKQFPVLADFETVWDLKLWSGDAKMSRSAKFARSGLYSCEALFSTQKYSSITLSHFEKDWQGMQALRFSVYSDQPRLELHYKIMDVLHKTYGMRYQDRFNGTILLLPGWNDISLSLEKVKHGPVDRELDLSKVIGLSFFVMDQKELRVLYFDSIELVP